jgi:hypothetical protein
MYTSPLTPNVSHVKNNTSHNIICNFTLYILEGLKYFLEFEVTYIY